MTSSSHKPLRGVRAVSLALNLPGPAAFMRLKALGATCLKVEPPGPGGASGDPMGLYNPQAYAQLHAGIKTVTLDLKTERGQTALSEQRRQWATVVETFRGVWHLTTAPDRRPIMRPVLEGSS